MNAYKYLNPDFLQSVRDLKLSEVDPAAAGSVDLELVQALRDQAAKDRESSADAKGYEAAARWDAWVGAYDHLLTVAAQDPRNDAGQATQTAK